MSFYQALRDRLFGAPGTWDLMRCPECGLIWLNPQPVPQDIGRLYERYHTHDIPKPVKKGIAYCLLKRCLEKFLYLIGLGRKIAPLDWMTLNEYTPGKLLDVVCGSGAFLAKMRELGWEVVGIEPDGQAVKVAREHFGLNIHKGTLEEADFPDDTFDAITMNHVIEHLLDPISILQECPRMLKSGGTLVVTPNIESLGHRLFSNAWRALEVPRHIYLFSPRSFQVCAERAGLKVLKLLTAARSALWIWATSRLIRRNGSLPDGKEKKVDLRIRLEGHAFQVVEYGVTRLVMWGEELVMVATK
jgi:SAM-dependent methyltransferase